MQAESSVTVEDYVRGIQEFDRGVLARAITLVESRKPEDMALAQELLVRLMAQTGDAVRVGIPVFQAWARAPLSTPWAPG